LSEPEFSEFMNFQNYCFIPVTTVSSRVVPKSGYCQIGSRNWVERVDWVRL